MENFNRLVDAVLKDGQSHMRPVIEKELLHYDILYSLSRAGLLDHLTFQGGTSLRLCYGAPRFSEDLDFTGGKDFDYENLTELKNCVLDYLGGRYGLVVNITTPKQNKIDKLGDSVSILKWQISITTAPQRKDIPRQRIKLEVANIESYSRQLRALEQNYEFLPDGYMDTLIQTQTLEETMADKLVAFVNSQRYIRHRDIWDLRWLSQKGARPNLDMVNKKIDDYQAQNYLKNLIYTQENLLAIIESKSFQDEMRRFIPLNVQNRTLNKEGFSQFLSDSVLELFNEVKNGLLKKEDKSTSYFKM